MDANTYPEARAVPQEKFFRIVVAGLLFLGFAVACAPSAAPIPLSAAPTTARAGGPSVARKSFNSREHPVRRNVTFSHANPKAQFNALPLPTDMPSTPPPGKGINRIRTLLIEPEVTIDGKVATTFDPPLTIEAEFTAQESAGSPRDAEGKPKLFIFTAWKEGNAWKWEKLPTTVACDDKECTRGTLTAQIKTLRPGDPLGEGE